MKIDVYITEMTPGELTALLKTIGGEKTTVISAPSVKPVMVRPPRTEGKATRRKAHREEAVCLVCLKPFTRCHKDKVTCSKKCFHKLNTQAVASPAVESSPAPQARMDVPARPVRRNVSPDIISEEADKAAKKELERLKKEQRG